MSQDVKLIGMPNLKCKNETCLNHLRVQLEALLKKFFNSYATHKYWHIRCSPSKFYMNNNQKCIICKHQVNFIYVYSIHTHSNIFFYIGKFSLSTCGVWCLLYFQNFPELTSCASLGSRAVLSV